MPSTSAGPFTLAIGAPVGTDQLTGRDGTVVEPPGSVVGVDVGAVERAAVAGCRWDSRDVVEPGEVAIEATLVVSVTGPLLVVLGPRRRRPIRTATIPPTAAAATTATAPPTTSRRRRLALVRGARRAARARRDGGQLSRHASRAPGDDELRVGVDADRQPSCSDDHLRHERDPGRPADEEDRVEIARRHPGLRRAICSTSSSSG